MNRYQEAIADFSYAFGKPPFKGGLKDQPEDFKVQELMPHEPSGEGEHFWLDLSKRGLSTERVAKALARYAGVAYRDVGYAGMKDVHAVTRQWFSVWLPKKPELDWGDFALDGVTVHSINKHNRKLKRGAHSGNRFEIVIRDVGGDIAELEERLAQVARLGVPNYFGNQRFGRDAGNLAKAEDWFSGSFKIKDRTLKGIVLSSARSFLFNLVVSTRIDDDSWCSLKKNEPAGLNGSNAIFASKEEKDNNHRLQALDIHPTAPLWGRGMQKATEDYPELADLESRAMSEYSLFHDGLESRGLEYQRRSIRCIPQELKMTAKESHVVLNFSLQSGQFATSLIRELIDVESE